MTEPRFELYVDQNRYLAPGQRVMDAVIPVSTADAGAVTRGEPVPEAAVVIMIDCSGSMAGEKIIEARRAATVAVEMLSERVAFAVVAGDGDAHMVYPAEPGMAKASGVTRDEANKAIGRMRAGGNTAMGIWLDLANTLLASQAAQIKHAILLTDGHHTQRPDEFQAALRRCRGRFMCDSLGVGKGWSAATLRAISDALHGHARGLPDARDLRAGFRAVTSAFMSASIADVKLRVWHPRDARILFLSEVYPRVLDLTGSRVAVTDLVSDYPIGSWSIETRHYQLAVELPPGNVGDDVLAAEVQIMAGERKLAEGLVKAIWTDNAALSTKISKMVAHYTGQVELDDVTQQGLAALSAGRVDEATAKLGRAVQLAAESQHRATLTALARVVDVIDAATAKVRIRAGMEQVDAEMLALQSRTTRRWRDG